MVWDLLHIISCANYSTIDTNSQYSIVTITRALAAVISTIILLKQA